MIFMMDWMDHLNSLLNDKILEWSKLKAFADDKINVNEKLKFDMGRVENIGGKGENRDYFLWFCTKYITCFSKYGIELIVALSLTNATKIVPFEPYCNCLLQMLKQCRQGLNYAVC